MKENLIQQKNRRSQKTPLLLWCGVAFAVTAVVSMIAAYSKELFPFGGQSIYYSDLATEFSTFLTELWRKVHTGGSLFYSWKTGVGGSFIGTFLFYCSSPSNLLVLLGKESSIDENIAILIYLRQALAAVSMCYYLSRRRGGRASFASALCGVLYAGCGWFCGFYFIIIWLDVFMLLPLLLLGIERIIDGGKPALYFVVLTWMLFANFYISYCVCLFAVIYWLYYYFSNYRLFDGGKTPEKLRFLRTRFFKAGMVFVVTSVLSALCLACLFVPFVMQMLHNTANEDTPSAALYFASLTRHITALFSGSEVRATKMSPYPPIYVGVLSLAAAPLYFLLKSVSRRAKVASAAVLVLIMLSFHIPALDYVWHAFRFPTNVTFRESFIFSLVVIPMAYRVLSDIRSLSMKAWFVWGSMVVVLMGCGIWELKQRGKNANITLLDLIITIGLFLMFAVMMMLLRSGRKDQLVVAAVFLFVLSAADIAYTFNTNIQVLSSSQEEIDGKKNQVCEVLDRIEDDSLFYRSEIATPWFQNDGAYFDYYGVRQSSSTASAPILQLLKDFGVDSNVNNCAYYEMQTPLFNSVFCVKYIVEEPETAEPRGLSLLAGTGESYRIADANSTHVLYRFDNALPLGFAADRSLTDWTARQYECPDNQGTFYAAAAASQESAILYCTDVAASPVNSNDLLLEQQGPDRYRVKKAVDDPDKTTYPGITFSATAQKTGMVYVYVEMIGDEYSNFYLDIPNMKTQRSYSFRSATRVYSGGILSADRGDRFSFSVYAADSIEDCTMIVKTFQIDEGVFNRQYDAIAKNGGLLLTEFSDTHFKGTVDVADDNCVLCLSVPYDQGWTVLLDGEELSEDDYSLIGGVLYGLPVTQGGHEVEFAYCPYGFRIGLVVSCCAVLAIAALLFFLHKKSILTPEDAAETVGGITEPMDKEESAPRNGAGKDGSGNLSAGKR